MGGGVRGTGAMKPFRLSRRALFAAPLLMAAQCPLRALAADANFSGFIAGVRRDALAQGIRAGTVDAAPRRAEFLPHVIELDRKQPEQTMTLGGFLGKVVTQQKINDGRA